MISRFFKKKPKPQPKPEPVRKAAPKKPIAKPTASKASKPLPAKPVATKTLAPKPTPKPMAEAPAAETYSFSLPSFKPGKIITAEGWKRMMMRKSGKK